MIKTLMTKAQTVVRHAVNETKPLRVGLVGCGEVAKHHARFITATEGAQLVGLADVNQTNAALLGRLYNVQHIQCSIEELLDSTLLDVVHIVTPPKLHYEQAGTAIERGVNVLVEKPLTLSPAETEDLYRRAALKKVSLCPDFIQIFNPLFQKAISLINTGELGRVVHIDSCWSLHANIAELRRSPTLHWSFSLPGGVFHNYITHPLYLTLFWLGNISNISVAPKSHGTLPQGLTDHLNITLEGATCTANIVLSFALRNDCYYVKIFCEQGMIVVDIFSSTLLIFRGSGLPRLVDRGLSNVRLAWQLSWSFLTNAIDMVRGKLVPYQGLKSLIPAFYASILSRTTPPVSPELSLAVSRTEADVIAMAGKVHMDLSTRAVRQRGLTQKEKVLVTGATGYIGSELCRTLVNKGYYVRAFVRPLSRTMTLEEEGVELVYGDVLDRNTLFRAMNGVEVVVHLAAQLKGDSESMVRCAVEGTENVAAVASLSGVNRVVYMSSMAVYDYMSLRNGDTISEKSPLEEQPEKRGGYSLAKRKAEDIALSHLGDSCPSWTILRPAMVVGNGTNIVPIAGFRLGHVLISFGSPRKMVRLIHVEDIASAVTQVIRYREASRGRIYTVSSDDKLTVRDYINHYICGRDRSIKVIYVPYWFAVSMVRASVVLVGSIAKGSPVNIRRLAYLYRDVRTNNAAIVGDLNWHPKRQLLTQDGSGSTVN